MDLTHEIFEMARDMTGNGREREGELLQSMCCAAGAELVSRLQEGVDAGDIRELFVTAAGILALSMYIEFGSGTAAQHGNIRVGNVSVSGASGGVGEAASAARLRRQAEHMLAAYLRDNGFDFRGVRG